nr:hypothetical protein CFP56_79497 [Quercus suber]
MVHVKRSTGRRSLKLCHTEPHHPRIPAPRTWRTYFTSNTKRRHTRNGSCFPTLISRPRLGVFDNAISAVSSVIPEFQRSASIIASTCTVGFWRFGGSFVGVRSLLHIVDINIVSYPDQTFQRHNSIILENSRPERATPKVIMAAEAPESLISPVTTQGPTLTFSPAAINDQPVELDGESATLRENVRMPQRRSSRALVLEDMPDKEREEREQKINERKTDPAVLVDVPEFGKLPGPGEVEQSGAGQAVEN